MKYFKSSLLIAVLGLLLALIIGGVNALYVVTLLAILEISLSFDNAVVNAKVLETMEKKWQERFIYWGMPIAVFGMRFLFPIVIVALASGLSILQTFDLALNDPESYHYALVSVEKLIFAFGGAFLLMVFLDFIFDDEREEQWIRFIEGNKLVKILSELSTSKMIITLSIGLLLMFLTADYEIAFAYFMGVLLHTIISSLDEVFKSNGVRSGIVGLLYLEVLDASFSFDGVIGAFALSSDIFVIMIGLGIGAMFVRSLTIYMVEQKTLTEYRYLEHGANYAILALALIMLLKIFIPVNEILIGSIGVTLIAVATYHSILENKKSLKIKT